ncbi:MAG: hypothetical protein AAF718_14590 [Pseudomonadota bacterium]
MSAGTALTLLLGPQTPLALAINAHLRENREFLRAQCTAAMPSRLASPLVRRALDHRPLDERMKEFHAAVGNGPAFLSAINMFGSPQEGLALGELFPDAEVTLAGLDPIIGEARIVLSIDVLPALFLAMESPMLEARVRRTSWEVLFELSWFDLVSELVALLPSASFLVLSGPKATTDIFQLEKRLFGSQADLFPRRFTLLRHLISETGGAVLDRIVAHGKLDGPVVTELLASFALKPSQETIRDKLGIDRLTGILLQQRFEEDVAQIATLDRVEVL